MRRSHHVASPHLAAVAAHALPIAFLTVSLHACTQLDVPQSPLAASAAPEVHPPRPAEPRSTTLRGQSHADGDPLLQGLLHVGSHGCAAFTEGFYEKSIIACWTAPLLAASGEPPRNIPHCPEPCAIPIGYTSSAGEIAVSPRRVCHVDPSNPSAITCSPFPTPPSTAHFFDLTLPLVPPAGSPPIVHPRVSSLQLGTSHGCFLRDDGVFCWGDNQFGQLGIGSTESQPGPQRVQLPRATSIAVGAFHSCAVLSDGGGVACWGRNDDGQLGFATADRCVVDSVPRPCSLLPRRVPGLTGGVWWVALGATFSCASPIRGDNVICWGAGAPRAIPRGAHRISADPRGSCATLPEHRVACWGDIPSPELDGVVIVDASGDLTASACAIRLDHTLWCWGEGYSPPDAQARPVRVHFPPQRDGSGDAVVASEHDPADCPRASKDSAATPPLDPHITCLARRSCDKPTTELPRCTRVDDAVSWDELRARADSFVGQSVAVRGALHVSHVTACTAAYCGPAHCCNQCESPYVISSGDSAPLDLPDSCSGDDSRLCCPWRAEGQTVIAVGVLRSWYGRHPLVRIWSGGFYGLEEAKLCEVRE